MHIRTYHCPRGRLLPPHRLQQRPPIPPQRRGLPLQLGAGEPREGAGRGRGREGKVYELAGPFFPYLLHPWRLQGQGIGGKEEEEELAPRHVPVLSGAVRGEQPSCEGRPPQGGGPGVSTCECSCI